MEDAEKEKEVRQVFERALRTRRFDHKLANVDRIAYADHADPIADRKDHPGHAGPAVRTECTERTDTTGHINLAALFYRTDPIDRIVFADRAPQLGVRAVPVRSGQRPSPAIALKASARGGLLLDPLPHPKWGSGLQTVPKTEPAAGYIDQDLVGPGDALRMV
jgi:hypothetical protein